MMLSPRLLPFVLFACAGVMGCTSTRTESYTVVLRNGSEQPVTVWLTKSGGPPEADWASPEEVGSSRAATVGEIKGPTIPPGRTGELGPVKGKFDEETVAILRVYAGDVSFDQLLATPVDGTLRIDVPLSPGVNRLEVRPGAKLRVEPAASAGAEGQR